MIAVPVTLTLMEPVLATALAGDPNSAASYPFIPGSLLRGAIIGQYTAQHSDDDIACSARTLFFNPQVCFLNAYPLTQDDQRTLPTPRSWAIEKGKGPTTPIYQLTTSTETSQPTYPRPLTKPFCWVKPQGEVHVYAPLYRFAVHTRRENRAMGRADEVEGNVFRYEALAAHQQFKALLLTPDSEIYQALKPYLAEQLFLGASRTSGYGQVSLAWDQEISDWREVSDTLTTVAAGQAFSVTLLSDMILTDKKGCYLSNLPADLLAEKLNVASLDEITTFRAVGQVGGFNQTWGLPLPQVPAMQAGSVFVFKTSTEISHQTLQQLETTGLGLRRNEGFGRIAFNWLAEQTTLTLTAEAPIKTKMSSWTTSEGLVTLTMNESRQMARQIVDRLAQVQVERALPGHLQTMKLNSNGMTASQPNRLRLIIRPLLANLGSSHPPDEAVAQVRDKVHRWLDDLKPTAGRQFEAATVNGTPLIDWIKVQLKAPDEVLSQLNVSDVPLTIAGATISGRTGLLAIKTILRLLDGVLARLAKEAKKND